MSSVKNGLYSIKIEMKDCGRGHASGVIVLLDGFTGTYSDGEAEVDGTALVGKTSVLFHAKLTLQCPL